MGCVLLRKGRVVVNATNVEGKTHPRQHYLAHKVGEPYRVSLHAELNALIKSRADFDTLVVARVNKSGEFCMSRPCAACRLAISEAGVRNVIYSTSEGWERLEFST